MAITNDRDAFPNWLRLWLVVQAAGLAAASLLDPDGVGWTRLVVWGAIAVVLAFGMWKHAKGAWVVAVILAIWSLIGSIPVVFVWTMDFDRNLAWFLWGLVLAVSDLGILLSRQARDWVNEPTERKWHYVPDAKG